MQLRSLSVDDRRTSPAQSDVSEPSPDAVLMVHWGRRNAGPLLLKEYAEALAPVLGDRLHVSGNRAVERAVRPAAGLNRFDVRTYRGGREALLGGPRLLMNALGLRRHLRRHGIRTVFAPMFSLWQTLALHLWLPSDVRYITAVHDAVDHPGERHPVRDLCRAIELHRADAVVVYSAAVEEAVRRTVRDDVEVVRLELGAPAPRVARDRARSVPVIGFFGRLVAYKGLDAFVDMLHLVAAEQPVRGEVHGGGEVPPGLRERSRALVNWQVGYIGEDAIAHLLQGLDVLVLPYQEASQSGVILQAFAAGLPVVVTPVGGLREQAEGHGGLVAAGTDARSLATAVQSVLDDPDLYRRLSAAAIATAVERGWVAVSGPLLELIESGP